MAVGKMVFALILGSIGTLVLGFLAKWVDRKVTARVQWRVGPPWYQPAVDCIKLMGKETVMPAVAQGTGFLITPLVGMAGACVAVTMLWVMNLELGVGFVGDAIVVMYMFAIPALTTILGAAASGNPHASLGASREMKLLLSYELPLTIALLVAIIHTGGSFRIGQIVGAQQEGSMVFMSISGVLAFLVALLCVQAKLGLIPFDMAEAECEIMAGVYTEYSGPPLAVIFMTRFMLLAALPIFLITIFLGGVQLTGWPVLASLIKFVIILVLITLIRNTNPRLRIDQSLRFFWYMLTPVALLALGLALIGRQYGVGWL
ncbi:MAG: NADH-quinone oxidoreductase subunit H [Planctomycetota bacterium]|nr:MAG: NADH-quinone oxidoreductase subunit H [Planctomycetota bacterium]